MHYYQFNIGDYLSHTRHLTPIEDICYRRALDYYYLHETALNTDIKQLARLLLLSEYQKELASVLDEYFTKTDEGYFNDRADAEIKQYQSFKEAGKAGAAKRWNKGDNSPPIEPPKPPLMQNINHKPINNKQKTTVNPPDGVALTLWSDYLVLRRAKKLPITQTALDGIKREADKAGISINEAITICCERGWGGFKADWLKAEAATKEKESQEWRNNDALMVQKAKQLGVNTTGKTRFEVIAAIDMKRNQVNAN